MFDTWTLAVFGLMNSAPGPAVGERAAVGGRHGRRRGRPRRRCRRPADRAAEHRVPPQCGVVHAVRAGGAVLGAGAEFAPPAAPAQRQGIVADVVQGARALRGRPVAVRLVGADVVCSVIYGMQTVLLLLLIRQLGFGAAGYGYVLAALGVGGILGTTAAGRAARSSRPRAVLAGALLVLAVPSSLMAVTPWLPGLLVLGVVGGIVVLPGRSVGRRRAPRRVAVAGAVA